MVKIHVQVTDRFQFHIKKTMPGEQVEHVIEKANAGLD
jgi:hypothetical protein